MRLPLLAAIAVTAGLGACAPVATSSYGYGYTETAVGAPYGYYAPDPYPYYGSPYPYATPYLSPGPTIVVGGERRFDRDRYREQRRYDGGYRGYPGPGAGPGRFDGGRGPVQPNFGGRDRPSPPPPQVRAPTPVAVAPPPQFAPPPGVPGQGPTYSPSNPTAQGGADR